MVSQLPASHVCNRRAGRLVLCRACCVGGTGAALPCPRGEERARRASKTRSLEQTADRFVRRRCYRAVGVRPHAHRRRSPLPCPPAHCWRAHLHCRRHRRHAVVEAVDEARRGDCPGVARRALQPAPLDGAGGGRHDADAGLARRRHQRVQPSRQHGRPLRRDHADCRRGAARRPPGTSRRRIRDSLPGHRAGRDERFSDLQPAPRVDFHGGCRQSLPWFDAGVAHAVGRWTGPRPVAHPVGRCRAHARAADSDFRHDARHGLAYPVRAPGVDRRARSLLPPARRHWIVRGKRGACALDLGGRRRRHRRHGSPLLGRPRLAAGRGLHPRDGRVRGLPRAGAGLHGTCRRPDPRRDARDRRVHAQASCR